MAEATEKERAVAAAIAEVLGDSEGRYEGLSWLGEGHTDLSGVGVETEEDGRVRLLVCSRTFEISVREEDL